MKNIISSIVTSIIVTAIVLAVALTGHAAPAKGQLGGNVNPATMYLNGGAAIGVTGDVVLNLQSGLATCTGSSTISATVKQNYDCAVTGVRGLSQPARDRVHVTMASTTPYGVSVVTAFASTTADNYIRVVLGNASSSPVTPVLSNVQYIVVR